VERALGLVMASRIDAAQGPGPHLLDVGPGGRDATGFVLNHPAATAPIIGPRTMEHLESRLPAADD
jgi:hypothetical protein